MKPRADEEAFRVRVENAFPSYFDADVERRVRSLITNTARSRGFYGEKRNRYKFSVLREARCAYERFPGERCGRVMRPTESAEGLPGHVTYRALDCGRWHRPAHYTNAPAALGDHVLDVLCEVFSPPRLTAVAERVRVDQGELSRQRAGIEALIRQEQGRVEAAAGMALEAEVKRRAATDAGDEEQRDAQTSLKERWEGVAAEAAKAAARHRKRLAALEAQEDEFLSAESGALTRVLQLATDLPALIERARGVPHALQRIVEALTERVWVRRVGIGVFEFSVEFASGAEVRRIFTNGQAPRGSQAQRLLARERLRQGVKPEEVACELAEADEVRLHGWTTDAVLGSAAYSEYFEHVRPRDGEHQTISEVARSTGVSEAEVGVAGLAGSLGPARWEGGALMFRPTERELHRAFPAFAAREVARVNGLGDTAMISFKDVQRANRDVAGKTVGTVRNCHAYYDAARNRWCRVVDVEARGLSMDANRALKEAAHAALAQAVAALPGRNLKAEDFVCAVDFARQIRRRFPAATFGRIYMAWTQGRICGVRTLGITSNGKSKQNLLFVRVPQAVYEAQSVDVVWDWLRGKLREGEPDPS